MRAAAAERGLRFAYLKDADQEAMRALDARCTPQAFLVDGRDVLRYHGRIDDAFVEADVRRRYLRDAILDVLAGRDVAKPFTMSLGCSVDRIDRSGATPRRAAQSPGLGT